jgi:hypothetical protein
MAQVLIHIISIQMLPGPNFAQDAEHPTEHLFVFLRPSGQMPGKIHQRRQILPKMLNILCNILLFSSGLLGKCQEKYIK